MLLRSAALLCALACAPPPAGCGPLGDLSKPVALLPIAPDAQGALHALHDGDALFLQRPPQGGFVAYAGVAATNLEACGAQLTAELVDPASGAPITGLDQRQVSFTVAADGYFWPADSYTQTANIPSCPDALQQGVLGRAALLRVDLRDADGRTARVEVRVTPSCAAQDAQCACLCGPNPQGC